MLKSMDALESWRFRPHLQSGEAFESWFYRLSQANGLDMVLLAGILSNGGINSDDLRRGAASFWSTEVASLIANKLQIHTGTPVDDILKSMFRDH